MKATTEKTAKQVTRALCLLLSGVAVGWITGLSTSPVIQYVIASLIAIIVSVTSALAGIRVDPEKDQSEPDTKPKRKLRIEVDPVPLMVMTIGFALGASFGVYARTNGWLAPDVDRFVGKWAATGLDQKEVSRRLFDTLYPPVTSGSSSAGATKEQGNSSQASDDSASKSQTSSGPEGVRQAEAKSAPANSSRNQSGNTLAATSGNAQRTLEGVLFTAISADGCTKLKGAQLAANERQIRKYFDVYGDDATKKSAAACQNMSCLEALIKQTCK